MRLKRSQAHEGKGPCTRGPALGMVWERDGGREQALRLDLGRASGFLGEKLGPGAAGQA